MGWASAREGARTSLGANVFNHPWVGRAKDEAAEKLAGHVPRKPSRELPVPLSDGWDAENGSTNRLGGRTVHPLASPWSRRRCLGHLVEDRTWGASTVGGQA